MLEAAFDEVLGGRAAIASLSTWTSGTPAGDDSKRVDGGQARGKDCAGIERF